MDNLTENKSKKICDSCPNDIPNKYNKENKISNMNQTTCDACLAINSVPFAPKSVEQNKMTQAELFKSYLQDEQLKIQLNQSLKLPESHLMKTDNLPTMTIDGKVAYSCLEEPLTVPEMFRMAQCDEQLVISSLSWDTDPQLAYETLKARIGRFEKMAQEIKRRAVDGYNTLRSIDAKHGEKYTLSTLERTKQAFKAKSKEKQKTLSKLEGIVKNLLLTGNTDEEIMEFIPQSKGSPSEIKLVIEKMKELMKEEE